MRGTIGIVGALALALLAALPASDADAGMIFTAPLERVVAHSTHVVLARRVDDAMRFRAERWLRGEGPEDAFTAHGVPFSARQVLLASSLEAPFVGPTRGGREIELSRRVLLFLEAVDGRLHLTGYRRFGGGFGAHASVRLFTTEGRPVRLTQVVNPGGPGPANAEAESEKELLAIVHDLLARHPYEAPPGDRPPIPPEHQDAFFAALDDVVDWYQGAWHFDLAGWSGRVASREDALAAANRLEAWMDGVPPTVRVHGLDALMLMGRTVQGRGVVHPEVVARARDRLHEVPPRIAEAWILRELRHGGTYANREAFARLARDLSPDSYAKALDVLVGWVERTKWSEGSDCWWTLVHLGHRALADAAVKRREARRARESEAESTSD